MNGNVLKPAPSKPPFLYEPRKVPDDLRTVPAGAAGGNERELVGLRGIRTGRLDLP